MAFEQNKKITKKVTTNQIKTIRRSFCRVRNSEQYFIRIPFTVVPILFYILNMFNCIPINELDDNDQRFVSSIKNEETVRKFLYNYHSTIFLGRYRHIINKLSDDVLKDKYQRLKANLDDEHSIIQCNYSDIKWDELETYAIK